MAKPYYMIDFSAAACMFEIRVNDIPVITQDVNGQVGSLIPINFGILKSGKQEINAKILPMSGTTVLHPNAELKYNIKLFDVVYDFVFKEEQAGHTFPKVDSNGMLPIMMHTHLIDAAVDYSISGWENGVDLDDIDDLGIKLRAAYNKVATMISNGNYDLLKAAISNREHIMATSMYLSNQEKEGRINGLIYDFENGFKVQPIAEDGILQIYGYGKVAALKKLNGESALFLYNAETKEELMIDIAFYIPAGKTEFEII